MIEVDIKIKTPELEKNIARIRIHNLDHEALVADYAVEISVDRGDGEVGLVQRGIWQFPRTEYNVLALLKQALETLHPEELRLNADFSPDLAGRQRGRMREIQAWFRGMHNH